MENCTPVKSKGYTPHHIFYANVEHECNFVILPQSNYLMITKMGYWTDHTIPQVWRKIELCWKSFRDRKAITKILNLMFTELFFPHNFNANKVSFDVKFNAYSLLPF